MNKTRKFKAKKSDILTNVVATATIASTGIANGRNIPVIIVKSDIDNKIDELIKIHQFVKNGCCESLWAVTNGYEYAMLILSFSSPIEQRIILFFDIIKQGLSVDQILYTKCMYLMTGDEDTRLSLNIDKPRLFLEVTCEGVSANWDTIYRKKYTKYLKNKYNINQKEAETIFNKIRDENNIIKTIRM